MWNTSEGKKAENLRKEKVPRSKDAAEVALKLHCKTNCRSSKALYEVPVAIPDGRADGDPLPTVLHFLLLQIWEVKSNEDEQSNLHCDFKDHI
ncbi:hypothetical protein ACFX2I_013333 [Malus domestica]